MYHQIPLIEAVFEFGEQWDHLSYKQAMDQLIGKMHATRFTAHIDRVEIIPSQIQDPSNFMKLKSVLDGRELYTQIGGPQSSRKWEPVDLGMFLGVGLLELYENLEGESQFLWPVFLNGEALHYFTFEDPEFVDDAERSARPHAYDMFIAVKVRQCIAKNTHITRTFAALSPKYWDRLFNVA